MSNQSLAEILHTKILVSEEERFGGRFKVGVGGGLDLR